MRRTRTPKSLESPGRLGKRQAILAALAKVTSENITASGTTAEPEDEINGYYTLSLEEMAALVNGDIEKIETWVSSLDRRHATWLLRWLIKEHQ